MVLRASPVRFNRLVGTRKWKKKIEFQVALRRTVVLVHLPVDLRLNLSPTLTGLGELVVSAQITVDLNLNKQYSPG